MDLDFVDACKDIDIKILSKDNLIKSYKTQYLPSTKHSGNFELDYKAKYLDNDYKILNYQGFNFLDLPESINYIYKFFYSHDGVPPEKTKKILESQYKNEVTSDLIIIKDVVYNPNTDKFGYLFLNDFLLYEGDVIKKEDTIFVFAFSPNIYRFVFCDVLRKTEILMDEFIEKYGLLYPIYNIDISNDFLIILNGILGLKFNYKDKVYRILDNDTFVKWHPRSVLSIKFLKDGFYEYYLYDYCVEKDYPPKFGIFDLKNKTIDDLLNDMYLNEVTTFEYKNRLNK